MIASVHVRGGTEPLPRRRACPFLDMAGPDPSMLPYGVLCRLRHDGRRAPSADELAWLCNDGHHHGCSTWRVRLEEEAP